MIQLARNVDPLAREVEKKLENEVDSVFLRTGETIAKALFAKTGTSVYPDATFTLRLSYGSVKGVAAENVTPFTTFGELFERNTGREPFALPELWLRSQNALNSSTRLNF